MTNKNIDEEFDRGMGFNELLKKYLYFDMTNRDIDKKFDENVALYELLRMYYDYFVNHSYHYKMFSNDSSIEIFFDDVNMVSLLELHHFDHYKESNQDKKLFYKLINEKATFELLKETNSQFYKKNLKRMQYFQFLRILMDHGSFGRPTLSRDKKNIDFYICLAIQNRNIYLGIKKEARTDTYYPVTFIEDDKKEFQHVEFSHSDGLPIIATMVSTSYRVY